MNLISFYEHVRCGLWASSAPSPLSAHYGLYTRGRDPPTIPSRQGRKKGALSLSSGCSRKVEEGVQLPSPPPPCHRRDYRHHSLPLPRFLSAVIATPPQAAAARAKSSNTPQPSTPLPRLLLQDVRLVFCLEYPILALGQHPFPPLWRQSTLWNTLVDQRLSHISLQCLARLGAHPIAY